MCILLLFTYTVPNTPTDCPSIIDCIVKRPDFSPDIPGDPAGIPGRVIPSIFGCSSSNFPTATKGI